MKPQRNYIAEFVEALMRGLEAWMQAGKLAAEAIAADPAFVDKVCAAHPDITPETVYRFERIGLKQLHPQLCLSEAPGVRRLRRLPFPIQEKYVKDPVEVLVKTDKGYEPLKIDVRNLTYEQALQAFDSEGERTLAAQRAYVETRVLKKAVPPERSNLPYRSVDDELVVMKACRIKKKELARILADME